MTQNKTPTAFLRGKKLRAIQALIACETIDEACKDCNITRSTMYRYMRDSIFDMELKRAKRQLINRAVLRLQQSCRDAAIALAEICRDKEAPPSARVAAAREILASSLKAIEIEELEVRIEKLEQKIKKER